jgi:hypothetical protein
MTTEPLSIVPGKSEAELARSYRDRVMPLLEQVCGLCTEARQNGLQIAFNLGPDQFGRQRIQMFDISKSLL